MASASMRGNTASVLLLLGGAIALSGCLFVTAVNERPNARLVATQTTAKLGEVVELDAQVEDDQSGAATELVVRDALGSIVNDPCVVDVQIADPAALVAHVKLRVWQVGTYTVEATPVDRHGARGSTATVQLSFANQPPALTAPASSGSLGELREATAPTVCDGNWPAAQPIPVQLSGEVVDPDAARPPPFADCATAAGPLSYRFQILAQPTIDGTLGPANPDGSCPSARPERRTELSTTGTLVCLYPDPSLSAVTRATYSVKLVVDDGTESNHSETLVIPVIGDAPACLDGSYPQAGSYVLPRDSATVFQAVGVDSVTASPSLSYVWSIERAGETAYAIAVPATTGADGGARFALDPAVLGVAVGEHVFLRVEVVDPAGGAVACDPADEARCEVASCVAAPATTCPRRATWELEYR